MSKARLVITAVTVEKRPVGEVARAYGVARSWVYTLLARYRAEGEAAFEPRSRRPLSSPAAISADAVELIVALRKELSGQGLDAGPDTIAWHLEHHHRIRVSAATVARYLAARGLVVPEPRKRPKSSYIRFQAEQPNECWQADFTHYPLAGGADTEILTWLDDHSRLALRVTAWNRVTGPVVLTEFRAAAANYGPRFHTHRQWHGLHHSPVRRQRRPQRLRARAAAAGHQAEERQAEPPPDPRQGRTVPADPQALAGRPAAQPATLTQLQALLDTFTSYYNNRRPHKSLPGRATPATAYAARPKATPGNRDADTHDRVRTDKIWAVGTVTLRPAGKLHHIGVGRAHAGTEVLILTQDLHIRIISRATGELLRELTLDPDRDYQPTGNHAAPNKKHPGGPLEPWTL